jgi:hypothetical protein
MPCEKEKCQERVKVGSNIMMKISEDVKILILLGNLRRFRK